MDEQLYRIHWKSRKGYEGKGERGFPRELAQQMCDEMNKADDDIRLVHWIEPEPVIDDLVEDGHAS